MTALTDKTEILEVQETYHAEGVTYSSASQGASTVTIPYSRWLDMGRPRRIVVTITPSETTLAADNLIEHVILATRAAVEIEAPK